MPVSESASTFDFSNLEQPDKGSSILFSLVSKTDAIYKKEDAKELFERLNNDLGNNKINRWAEKQNPHCSGIMIDFDIFQPVSTVQFTAKIKFEICRLIMCRISEIFDLRDIELDSNYDFGRSIKILEISKVYDRDENNDKIVPLYSKKNSEQKVFKDGFHFLIPEIMISRSQKHYLIEKLMADEHIKKIYADCLLSEREIIDTNSKHVPVMCIGSAKPKARPYEITKLYKFQTKEKEMRVLNLKNVKKFNLVAEFSLNEYGIERYTDKRKYNLCDEQKMSFIEWENAKKEEKLKNKPNEDTIKKVKSQMANFVQIISEAINGLKPDINAIGRLSNSHKWKSVLGCLKQLQITYDISDDYMEDLLDEVADKEWGENTSITKEDVIETYDHIEPFGYTTYLLNLLKKDNPELNKKLYARIFKIVPQEQSKYKYYDDYYKLLYASESDEDNDIMRENVPFHEALDWIKACISQPLRAGNNKSSFLIFDLDYKRETSLYEESYTLILKKDLKAKLDDLSFHCKQLPDSNGNKKKLKNKNQNIKLSTVFQYAIDMKLIKKYKTIEEIPYSGMLFKNKVKKVLNIFSGFSIKRYMPIKELKYEDSNLFKHINRYMAHEDNGYYFHRYLAHMFQKPAETPGVAVLFKSVQGIGKDTLGIALRKLIGFKYTTLHDNADHFLKSFNSNAVGKLLTILNEIGTRGSYYDKADMLKSFITRETAQIEPKFKEQFETFTFSRYMFFTNHDNVLNIEPTDRRYCMYQCKTPKFENDKQKETYWLNIREDLNDIDYLRCMYDYYYNLDISNFDVRKAPMTNYKRKQKQLSLPSSLQFIKDLFDDNAIHQLYGEEKNGIKIVSKRNLYDSFKNWCSSNNEHIIKCKNFISIIENFGLQYKRYRINGTQLRGYKFNRDEMQICFRNYLKDNYFKFKEDVDVDSDVDSDLDLDSDVDSDLD